MNVHTPYVYVTTESGGRSARNENEVRPDDDNGSRSTDNRPAGATGREASGTP